MPKKNVDSPNSPHSVCKLGNTRTYQWIFFNHSFPLFLLAVTDPLQIVATIDCRFYFDFSMTFVGAGMICSHLVNLSLLLGSVLSFGVMWPLIGQLKGHWFSESLDEYDMKSLYGYKVSLNPLNFYPLCPRLDKNFPITGCIQ